MTNHSSEVVYIKELSRDERNAIVQEVASRTFSKRPSLDLINEGAYASLYRICGENRVLKISSEQRIDLEELFYKALTKRGVPVIGSQRLSKFALCLEDLATSENWRLATQQDVHDESIGLACASWYQAFHNAGRTEYKENPELGALLSWEYDSLTEEALHHAGQLYSLNSIKSWNQACEMTPAIIDYLRQEIDTFTYNDFFYVNLAVSTNEEAMITVFDYDHSGKGFAESDYSNVVSGLYGDALEAFQASMPVDKRILLINELLATLHGLVVASQRERTPTWALQLIESVRTHKLIENLEEIKSLLYFS